MAKMGNFFWSTHTELLSKYKNLIDNNSTITSFISLQITRDNKEREEKSKKINGTNTIIGKLKSGNTKSDILAQLDQSRQPAKWKSTGTPRKQPSTEDFIHFPGANKLQKRRRWEHVPTKRSKQQRKSLLIAH
jgi:hypothetical protein